MWLAVRLVVCAVLLWQAIAALVPAIEQAHAGLAVPVGSRFLTSTEDRIRHALGNDADVLFALRDAAPAGTTLVTQKVMGRAEDYEPAQLMQLAHKNHLIDQLTVLLYPEPWIVSAPDPMTFIERQVREGHPTALLWLPGDKRPTATSGWRALHEAPGFEIWQFRTD